MECLFVIVAQGALGCGLMAQSASISLGTLCITRVTLSQVLSCIVHWSEILPNTYSIAGAY